MDFDNFIATVFATILSVIIFYLIGLIILTTFNCILDISRTYVEDYISDTDSVEVQPDAEENPPTITIV